LRFTAGWPGCVLVLHVHGCDGHDQGHETVVRSVMEETRYDQMKDRCNAFHQAHPEVWSMFVRFTRDRISRGFQTYSSDAIFHRIRWETAKPSYEKGTEFKLNDHYTAFYARRFMRLYPEYEGFFRTRKQTSKEEDPSPFPELGPDDYPTYPNSVHQVAP